MLRNLPAILSRPVAVEVFISSKSLGHFQRILEAVKNVQTSSCVDSTFADF